MPLTERFDIAPQGFIGLWAIEEAEDWFRERLPLAPWELEQLEGIILPKRLEFLAARMLAHEMSGSPERIPIRKDRFGKPFLPHSSLAVSLSHSKNYAAVMLAPGIIGIDIQHLEEKIKRLAPRFVRPEEMETIEDATRLEHLHVYWSAKEALYKAHGKRSLDFCDHILMDPFPYQGPEGKLHGMIIKDEQRMDFHLEYRLQGAYMLVWAQQKGS